MKTYIALGVLLAVAGVVRAAEKPVVVSNRGFAISHRLRDLPTQSVNDGAPLNSTVKSQNIANYTVGLGFDGLKNVSYRYPDANGAAGTTQYMQWANARYAVYSKSTGAALTQPINAKNLWANLGGPCATTTAGDGIIRFDRAAGRWVVTHHTGSTPYLQCVAVSTTSDATGSYFLYAFSLAGNNYPDYTQLGVWSDAYYVTSNLLNPKGFTNITGQVCALDRSSMLAGSPTAAAQCFTATTKTTYSVLQPADIDGSIAPPANSPAYLLALDNNALDLFRFQVDWANPANSSFTGPVVIPVDPFTQACNGGFCVPQGGTTQVLDADGDRLLHRLAYRNFGTSESLTITHGVNIAGTVGVRWYEIRDPNATPVVYQSSTYAPPDGLFRWLGSSAMDKLGNLAVGYSVSSATTFPGIRFAGRQAADPLGQLGPEVSLFFGSGSDTSTGSNWGNASSLSVDPVDDCTFWYTNEYLRTTGTLWYTRIASFKFTACQ